MVNAVSHFWSVMNMTECQIFFGTTIRLLNAQNFNFHLLKCERTSHSFAYTLIQFFSVQWSILGRLQSEYIAHT